VRRRALSDLHTDALTVICQVGVSLVHIADALVTVLREERARLSERLRDL
jgi:hypothetical protein